VTCILIATQQNAKHIPAEANIWNNRTSTARQRHNKHASSTIQAVFSVWSVPRGYKRTESEDMKKHTHVEAGSNTSTVTPRVVGGDDKGSLKSETVKMWSRVPRDSDLRKTTLARVSSIYKRHSRHLVREGTPQKQDRNCQRVINIWS
jgi:hypothetical protein